MIILAYFLSRTPKPSGQNPFLDFANSIGKFDFFVMIIFGIFAYAFPDILNGVLGEQFGGANKIRNETYRSMTRSFGAFLIGMSIESFCLSELKFIRDKKALLSARFLVTRKLYSINK